jgi:dihydrofolate reductase
MQKEDDDGKSDSRILNFVDGFIAGPNDNPEQPPGEGGERLFEWFFSGDTEFTMPSGGMTLKLSRESADAVADVFRSTGAIVSGRRMLDVANGWGGRHPIDAPVFVVTDNVPRNWIEEHKGAPFTFVTDGLESAVKQAQQAAGDKIVGVGGANVAQQCLKLGLLDEIYVQLVPVLQGGGVRLFDHMGTAPPGLETTRVIDAPGVTHLTFRVVKETPPRTRHQPFEAPAKA